MDYFKCANCNNIFHDGDVIHEQVSGRTGGYDNWMPDEDSYYCPHCETDISESGSEEYGMEDAIEELQNRPTCEEVEALRDEVERLHKLLKETKSGPDGSLERTMLRDCAEMDRAKTKGENT